MKNLILILLLVSLSECVLAQAPQRVSYQALIRDSNGKLVTNHSVGIRISILQNSEHGSEVYTETQNLNSNENGLISLAVGNNSGFDTIHWVNGPYFLKIEIDPKGGSDYSISATSQLLSVPYALYAINSGNTSLTKISAGKNISVTGNGTTLKPYIIESKDSNSVHYLGEHYGGGMVFYVYDNGHHGLITSLEYQGTPQWYNGSYKYTNATRDGIGAGQYNTERIIAAQGPGDYAAQECANYTGGGFGDWYLPSKAELDLLYQAFNTRFGFLKDYLHFNISGHWSSTEVDTTNAWYEIFDVELIHETNKNLTGYVRAIRAF